MAQTRQTTRLAARLGLLAGALSLSLMACGGGEKAAEGEAGSKGGDEGGRSWLQAGVFWFVVPTALQIVVGLWWLLMLPREVMMPFMGGDTAQTMVFMISITLPMRPSSVAAATRRSSNGSTRAP